MSNVSKEQIIQYMLKLIDEGDSQIAAKTTEYFGISKSSVYNYLRELSDGGIIEKNNGVYGLSYKQYDFRYENDGKLGEDRIFTRDVEPLLSELPKNTVSVWRYSFTAMMNNAIEHSSAKEIIVSIRKSIFKTVLLIADNGIGIFKNIQSFLSAKGEELSLDECATLLFAGKFTTAESLHSGEGIFFTSHMMDGLMIISDGIIFTRDNFADYKADNMTNRKGGTIVFMELNNHTKKTTLEIFNRFSSIDEGFIRTSIPIAHFFPSGYPVSRSEARRLGETILKFEEIDLDFSGVEEVGQAFVHELFVVWQTRNPKKRLNVLNASEGVTFMIQRVLNTK